MIDVNENRPWTWYVERADALLAVTDGRVWLHEKHGTPFDATLYPWHLPIETVRAGSTYYGDIPEGVVFEAKHPNGLRFSWTIAFYHQDNDFIVDATRLALVMSRIPDPETRARLVTSLGQMRAGLERYLRLAQEEVAKRQASLRVLADYDVPSTPR